MIQYSTVNVLSPFYVFLNNSFSLAYFIVRTQHIIHIKYKMCVNRLLMLLVRLPVNSRVLVVKFWGSQKLYEDFQLQGAEST